MEYLDFEVEIAARGKGATGEPQHVVSVRSPAGEFESVFDPPFESDRAVELLSVENALLRAAKKTRRASRPDADLLRRFGEKLFKALLSSESLAALATSREKAASGDRGLRIRLVVRDADLAVWPWELLYDHVDGEYLALSRRTPFVRYVRLNTPPKPLRVNLPLQVLGLSASPGDMDPLELEEEEKRLESALTKLRSRATLRWLRNANRESLRNELLEHDLHVLHVAGHGGFDEARGEGYIALEGKGARSDLLFASDLGMLLRDKPSLRLVVLSSCDGARAGLSSTAAELLARGVPAVIGMQYPVTDEAALVFTRALYGAIVVGQPIDAAVAEARKALRLGSSFEWATPILFMRAPDGVLFELPPPAPEKPVAVQEPVIVPEPVAVPEPVIVPDPRIPEPENISLQPVSEEIPSGLEPPWWKLHAQRIGLGVAASLALVVVVAANWPGGGTPPGVNADAGTADTQQQPEDKDVGLAPQPELDTSFVEPVDTGTTVVDSYVGPADTGRPKPPPPPPPPRPELTSEIVEERYRDANSICSPKIRDEDHGVLLRFDVYIDVDGIASVSLHSATTAPYATCMKIQFENRAFVKNSNGFAKKFNVVMAKGSGP